VQITADVWNVGDSDQDEVKVVIFNSELGINEVVEIGDINDFDNEVLDAFVEIPSDVEEKHTQFHLKFLMKTTMFMKQTKTTTSQST